MSATIPSLTPPITVEKDYRYTNVCFERDNDGDGLFNEDPVNFDADNNPMDNDGDGLSNEDLVDCPDGTYLGDTLPMDDDGNYILEAVINKRSLVTSYNPGQYYTVSTVTVLEDVDMLTIEDNFSGCITSCISVLNPQTGGGRLVVVQIREDGEAYQILDANSPEVSISGNVATVSLGPQAAGITILVYVKFGPGLKDQTWTVERTCVNENSAWVVEEPEPEDIVSDSASLKLIRKE